jgi:undecaprenyl-diphosphatase
MYNGLEKHNRSEQRAALNLALAFAPAAVAGVLAIKPIKTYLFNGPCVGAALVLGGLVILWVEHQRPAVRITRVDDMSWRDALKVGCAQILALIPGTSRSGATIIGGMLFGLERRTATEFSFFLAIPTMFAATLYDIYKNHDQFSRSDLPVFAVGLIAAFVSALLAVRGLIRFVSAHSFNAFAWYRIGFGLLILMSWHFDWIRWSI